MPRPPVMRRRPPARSPRRREAASPSLFDAIPGPPPEDAELLEDLMALVALGLLEERPSPDGAVYALTELGKATPPSP